MNGSKSPVAAAQSGDTGDVNENAPGTTNGHESPAAIEEKRKSSPVPSREGADEELPDAPAESNTDLNGMVNGADEDAASEAETFIESPVKRREAERRNAAAAARTEKPQKSRIGSLPVPQDDDDDGDSAASPLRSTEISVEGKATSTGDAKEEDVQMVDEEEDAEGSDALSSVHSSPSPGSSRSRAGSENPEDARNGAGSPNPRKRKHRASSVGLPSSKRRSMDPPARRRLRGMHSGDHTAEKAERSPSPKPRGHRRAVSTQSALDGTAEGSPRKRRGSQFPVREPKSAKSLPSLEESDASSETTSRGQDEFKRPQRGIGRSTSTPGRPVGREHKRHVNKYGFTRLAEACEAGDLDLVKEWRERDPDQLELAEFAGNKPIQIAALNGNAEVVAYLIEEGAQTDCANVDKDTPLIDAAENGHLEVVKLLLNAGVDPLRQNLKGQQALDVVTDENEEASGIRAALHAAIDRWNSSEAKQRREEEEEHRHRAGPSKELHFMARTYENLLKLVQNNDRNGVQEFLAARVPVDNAIIAAAAKTGDLYLVNMLLAEMSDKKLHQKPEKAMLSVLGTSHFEMLKALTELEQFNPHWRNRAGKTWPEQAEERNGPMWRQEKELLLRLFDRAGGEKGVGKERTSSSPVSKREVGRRKLLAQRREGDEEGESEEDDEEGTTTALSARTKRKNGRRLMSRKDLRTAKGGALSNSDDGSSEDAPGEAVAAEEEAETMKPPETPNMRRRLRSKSQSGSPEVSPKTLRKKRSSSFRATGVSPSDGKGLWLGLGLETVNEEKDGSGIEVKSAKEDLRKAREEEARVALELAKKAEEKRREEEAAEAEAKRAEEEARRKAEEERRAEQERKAEELRREEELRKEQARKEEEERLQRERELEEERRKYRTEVLEALPKALARVLDPESEFKFEDEAQKSWLEEHFTPLRVVESDSQEQDWVLNVQAAALVGKSGLELFFGEDCPYYDSCLASQWSNGTLAQSDWDEAERILTQMPMHAPPEDGLDGDEDLSFEEELKKTAERYNAVVDVKRRLKQQGCQAVLRRVKLADVLSTLHPLLKGMNIEVESARMSTTRREEIRKDLEAQRTTDFVGRMKAIWDGTRPPGQVADVMEGATGSTGGSCATTTDMMVVHEK